MIKLLWFLIWKISLYADTRPWYGNLNLNGTEITSDNNEKLLGVLIDKKLSFDVHIKSLCIKAGQKLSTLARVSSYLTLDQKLLLISYKVTA